MILVKKNVLSSSDLSSQPGYVKCTLYDLYNNLRITHSKKSRAGTLKVLMWFTNMFVGLSSTKLSN